MPFTDSYKNTILNAIFNNTSVGAWSPWVGLFTDIPSTAHPNGIEVSDPVYQRVPASFTVTGIIAAAPSNLIFPGSTVQWGFILGFGLFDAQTNGNLVYYDTFRDIYLVKAGAQYIIDYINIQFNL